MREGGRETKRKRHRGRGRGVEEGEEGKQELKTGHSYIMAI